MKYKIIISVVILLILSLISISTLCSCCVKYIEIKNAKVISRDESNVKIMITTNLDISKYDDSFYAHKVFLEYDVINLNELTYLNLSKYNDNKNWNYSAKRSIDFLDTNDLLITNWIIDLNKWSKKIGFNFNKESECIILIRLNGGKMIGTSISSNIILIKI